MINSPQTIYVIIGVILFTLMGISVVIFIVYYQRKQFRLQLKQQNEVQELKSVFQKQMLENSLEVQESVRKNISRDLHDEIGGLLSATKMSIAVLSRNIGDNEDSKEKISNAKELVEEALSQVRSLARELVPRTLESFGLVPAIEEFAQKMQQATGVKFEVRTVDMIDESDISPKIKLAIYRVIQELANNAIKHAESSLIFIRFLRKGSLFRIEMSDNGLGFDLDKALASKDSGLGLRNIQSRLSVINASYAMTSTIGKGSGIKIDIDL